MRSFCKNTFFIAVVMLLTFVVSHAQSDDAVSIIKSYQEANSFKSLTSEISYKNVSKKGRVQQRELRQYIMQKSKEDHKYKFLLKFSAPRDIAGTSTLTIQHDQKNDDQWLYLPAIRATKKISASKKSDRFMGTEMTYEDLSNYLSEPIEEYEYSLMESETIDGVKCHKILSLPRKTTKSQYSKKILWVDPVSQQMLRMEFFDRSGELLKYYVAADVRKVGADLYRAHNVTIKNVKTGNMTEVVYTDFQINDGVSGDLFSKSYMESN